MRWFACLAVCASCSGSDAAAERRESPRIEPAPPSTQGQAFELGGDVNGAYWDAATHALFVTDSTHDAIVTWTDAGGFEPVGALPGAAKVELGGLVRLADGRFVTTSFGFGTDGGVFVLGADGASQAIAKLDPVRRRVGIALGHDGVLYDAYFLVQPGGKHTGGVARLDLATGETDLVGGLRKPVGIAATATALYVADQEQGVVLAYPLADLAHPVIVARDLPSADLLTILPNGDLVTGGKRGAVYRITERGAVTTIASGFEQVRGTAYDAAGKRLFVIEHSAATSHHKLHIIALD